MIKYLQELELVENWLLSSGIQDQSNEDIRHGGVYAWYDKGIDSYSFLYSEITGYALTWFAYQYSSTKNDKYLLAAYDAANWLIERAMNNEIGGVMCRHDGNEWRDTICAFCNGMVLNGFCNVYKISKNNEFRKKATDIGNCLLKDLQKDNGSFYSKFDPTLKEASNPGGKWSLISGAFLIKLAIGLLNLKEITGNINFQKAAKELCDWGLGFQEVNGRFRTSPDPEETFLHPHCYAAEGLLVAGLVLNESKYIKSALKAVTWISDYQNNCGGFPSYYSNGLFKKATSPDMTAQVIRLWLMLDESERPNIDISSAIESIIKLQVTSKKASIHGGIMAGDAWFSDTNENLDSNGQHFNSWVSMFSAQAIRMSINSKIDPFHMV